MGISRAVVEGERRVHRKQKYMVNKYNLRKWKREGGDRRVGRVGMRASQPPQGYWQSD